MIELSAFRRSLHVAALALCSATFSVTATPASARSHHGAGRHARAYHAGYSARRHFARRHFRHIAHRSRWERGVALMHSHGLADSQASLASPATSGGMATSGGFGSSGLVSEARPYLGGNPTGRGSLWCARFMNMVLEHTGHRG